MSVEMFTQTIPAAGTIFLPSGNFLLLYLTTANVNLRVYDGVNAQGVDNAPGNTLIRRITTWREAQIVGVAGTVVTYVFGTEASTEQDVTDVRAVVSQITGTVTTTQALAGTIAASPAQATLATATSATVAASLTAKRRIVCVDSLSVGSGPLYVQAVGTAAANRGVPIQLGQCYEIPTSAAFDLRNDSGGNVLYNYQEFI